MAGTWGVEVAGRTGYSVTLIFLFPCSFMCSSFQNSWSASHMVCLDGVASFTLLLFGAFKIQESNFLLVQLVWALLFKI